MSPLSAAKLPLSLERLLERTPEVIALDNGLTLLFQQDLAHPLVSVQTWVKTGSIHEDRHLGSGLSHFLEHMLFKGTGRRAPGEVASEVQAFGGQINAYTAFDRTVYYIDGPNEALAQSLDILADMTLSASLPKAEVQKEKEVILREIDMTLDDPDRILSRSVFSTAYREHAFRYPVIGLRPLFEQVTRDVLDEYHRARYRTGNMVLAVAGHVEREELLEQVGATFGAAPIGIVKPLHIAAEPRQLAVREARLYGDYKTARGLIAFKIPSMRHEDAPGLDILGALIGAGQSCRLRQKLREELGLVHAVSASAWNPGNPGLFFIQYQCAPDKAAEAEDRILAECAALAQASFTDEELEKARRFATVSEIQMRQTTSGIASRMGLMGALVGELHYPERYFHKLYNLTPRDLNELAARTFRQDQATIGSLLPDKMRPRKKHGLTAGELPPVEGKTLGNGARLYWQVDKRLPRTWMRFAGLGGPQYESPETRGATSLMATLLTRDTEFQTAAEVAHTLENSGGFIWDASGNNTFSVGLEVMPESVGQGISILHNALLHPAFREETVRRERDAQVAHLHEMEDDITDFGRLALRRHFFGAHPFASHPCGTLASASRLDVACLKDLHHRLLTGSNAVFVITGDFDPDKILPEVEQMLLGIPQGSFTPEHVPFTGPSRIGEFAEQLDREQAIVFEAYPDVGIKGETDLVAEVLDEILSDMSGPLYRSVREDQSLAYFVGASRLLGLDFGCFSLYAGTHPDTVQAVFNCFEIEMDRIRKGGVGDDEFKAALTRMRVQNRFSLQGPATRAGRVALNALYGKPIMDWLDFETRLDALTPGQVASFAGTILSPENRLRLTITPNLTGQAN
jgi:zinc protease